MSGTAPYSLGQYNEVAAAVLRALPKALKDTDPAMIIRFVQTNGEAIEEALRKILLQIPSQPSLLGRIGTVSIDPTQKFVAADKFVVGTGGKTRVKISFLGDNFKEWFLRKTEKSVAETTLCYAKLVKSSVDSPILAELGDKAETALSQTFMLMERQPNGEEGVLLANGWVNIFYVRDINGALRSVGVHWIGGGWFVLANSVEDPLEWRDGSRVFSRNS